MQGEAAGTEWPTYLEILMATPATEETKLAMKNKVYCFCQDSRWKIATYSIFQDGSTPAPDLNGQVCAHDDGRSLSLPQ